MQRIEYLNIAKGHVGGTHDAEEMGCVSILDLRKTEDEIDEEIETLRQKSGVIWDECNEHADSTNYVHYLQLHIDIMNFY